MVVVDDCGAHRTEMTSPSIAFDTSLVTMRLAELSTSVCIGYPGIVGRRV